MNFLWNYTKKSEDKSYGMRKSFILTLSVIGLLRFFWRNSMTDLCLLTSWDMKA